MKDSKGNEIKTGDICFYTEMPHSNYADSLVYIYEEGGDQYIGSVVINYCGEYVDYDKYSDSNIEIKYYGMDSCLNQTGACNELTVIEGLTLDLATVEYANEHYPLQGETK